MLQELTTPFDNAQDSESRDFSRPRKKVEVERNTNSVHVHYDDNKVFGTAVRD